MGQGRFDFGSFLTWQGDQNASQGEITTLVVEGVSPTHDAALRAKLDNSRGCVCTERYMDMIAARFRTNAKADTAGWELQLDKYSVFIPVRLLNFASFEC